jgi:hypothetical protein
MENSDQDIDTAGTEADEEFRQRHEGEPIDEVDPTEAPAGAATPEFTPTARGSEPRTLHRGEDDEAAMARSPEFHDVPDRGRKKGNA